MPSLTTAPSPSPVPPPRGATSSASGQTPVRPARSPRPAGSFQTAVGDLRAFFLPYQIRWLTDERPVAVAEKSRRIGWTYASAFRAVERRLRVGTSLFYTAADLTGAREFVEDCCRWARVFEASADDLGLRPVDDAGLTAFVVRFANGARVVAGSSSPKFFRGKGGDVDADEFAFHDRPRDLYKAMQPAALMWGHQLRVWSTHNGHGSFFHNLVRAGGGGDARGGDGAVATSQAASGPDGGRRVEAKGGADGGAPTGPEQVGDEPGASDPLDPDAVPMTNQRVATHRVTLLDAVAQGLVERIRNLSEPSLAARRAFVEEIRGSCPDEAAFREEYLCEPHADGSALLGYAAIAACEAPNLRLADVEALAAEGPTAGGGGDGRAADGRAAAASGPLYAGFDVGRKQDRSVLWVVERVGDVLWTRCVRVMGDAPFAAQEQLVDRLLQNRRVRRLCVDATGIGLMLAERLAHRHGHRVEPIHFTAPVKAELAMPLVRLFQGRLVRVPADPAVREDLHKVRRTVTAAHHVRLDAPRDTDGHADRFWALALACHAAEQSPAAAAASLPRKPVGW